MTNPEDASHQTHSTRMLRESGIFEPEMHASLRLTIAAGMFGTMWLSVVEGMPLVMLMEALGASNLMIGLLTTIHLLTLAGQIPGAYLAERQAFRKGVWARFVFTARLLWVFPPLLAWFQPGGRGVTAWLILLVVAVSGTLNKGSAAPWWSWMADLIPTRLRSRYWGRRQAAVMTTHLLFVGVTGWILDHVQASDPDHLGGFVLVLALACVFGVTDIVIHLFVREPRPAPAPTSETLMRRLLVPFAGKDFRRLTLGMGALAFSVGLAGPFAQVYLKTEFDVSYLELSYTILAASLGTVVAGLAWPYWMQRTGLRAFGVGMILLLPLMGGVWFFVSGATYEVPLIGAVPQAVFWVTVNSFFAGAFFSGVSLAQFGLISALAPREGRTMAMAVHWTTVGFLGAAGPFVGGGIADLLRAHPLSWTLPSGHPIGFLQPLLVLHALGIWFVALPLLRSISVPDGEYPVRLWARKFLVLNPLRTAGWLRNLTIALRTDADADAVADAIADPQGDGDDAGQDRRAGG